MNTPQTPEQIARDAGFTEEDGRIFRTVGGVVQEALDWGVAAGMAEQAVLGHHDGARCFEETSGAVILASESARLEDVALDAHERILCAAAKLASDGSYRVTIWCSRAAQPKAGEFAPFRVQLEARPQGKLWDWQDSFQRVEAQSALQRLAVGAKRGIYWRELHGTVATHSTREFDSCEEMIDHVITNVIETQKSEPETGVEPSPGM